MAKAKGRMGRAKLAQMLVGDMMKAPGKLDGKGAGGWCSPSSFVFSCFVPCAHQTPSQGRSQEEEAWIERCRKGDSLSGFYMMEH